MKHKNRYYSRSKISEAKFRQIIRFFAMDFTATDTANHGDNEFACGNRHINGIESFWSYAKKRLIKFNGIDKKDVLSTS